MAKYYESWDNRLHDFVPTPSKVVDFLDEYEALCKKYNLSLGHEDEHGSFVVQNYEECNINWVKESNLDIEESK
jgi:hypothetical protein